MSPISKPRSAPTSTATTNAPSRSPGPKPPTTFSVKSNVNQSTTRDTRAFLDRDHHGHLRASVRRGRPPGPGGGRLSDRAGGAVVTAAVPPLPSAAAPGLLRKLIAVTRPEFRVDILVPERGALVFDTAPCRVPGCLRQPRTRGLCKGHYVGWQQEGRPDIE